MVWKQVTHKIQFPVHSLYLVRFPLLSKEAEFHLPGQVIYLKEKKKPRGLILVDCTHKVWTNLVLSLKQIKFDTHEYYHKVTRLTTVCVHLPGWQVHSCNMACCCIRFQRCTHCVWVTTCGTVVVHTAIEVDAWVNEFMAGFEGSRQE